MLRGKAPKIRIFAKLAGLDDTWRRLDYVTAANARLSVASPNMATITFSNANDRYHKAEHDRPIAEYTLADEQETHVRTWVAEESAYVRKMIPLDLVQYWNPYYRPGDRMTYKERQVHRKQLMMTKYYAPMLSLMDPIFVDMLGRDGRWYGVFTGYVSSVSDNLSKSTANASVIVKCYDYSKLFAAAPVLTQEPLILDSEYFQKWYAGRSKARQREIDQLRAEHTKSNAFKHIVSTMSLSGFFDFAIKVMEASYSQPLWTRARRADLSATEHRCIRSGDSVVSSAEYEFPKRFIVDEHFSSGEEDHRTVQKMFRDFNLMSIQYELLSNLLNSLIQTFFGYYYVDGLGNLYVELPKYEHLPLSSTPSDFAQKDQHSPYLQYAHGPNYNIGDDSVQRWESGEQEEGMVTKVEGMLQEHYIGTGSDLVDKIRHYNTVVLSEAELVRYGFRVQKVPSLYVEHITDTMRALFKKYLQAALITLNAKTKNLNITFNQRPDLLLNRNLYLIERELFALITDISHTYVEGKELSTSVTCTHVRRAGESFKQPWLCLQELAGQIVSVERNHELDPIGSAFSGGGNVV